jgi:hypothetical protein
MRSTPAKRTQIEQNTYCNLPSYSLLVGIKIGSTLRKTKLTIANKDKHKNTQPLLPKLR